MIHSKPYTMPALAQDRWWKPEVSTGLTEDRWIRAIEIRPSSVDGRRITHHALARLQQEEDEDALGAASDVGPGLLMEWAVGKQGEIMRPNSGKLLKAGSSIVWDIHYHAVGEEITDTVELGLYFYPKGEEPKHRQVLSAFSTIEGGGDHLSIPPNALTVTERFHVLKQNGRVENYQPHMHLRGKGMQMTAVLPDGTTQVLSRVSDFNFNWHNNYVYAPHSAPLLPKGTVLQLKSWYDNTSANRANPDPNQWVGYGDRTVDEMGHAWVNVTYLDDDDYAAAVAEREALTTTNENQELGGFSGVRGTTEEVRHAGEQFDRKRDGGGCAAAGAGCRGGAGRGAGAADTRGLRRPGFPLLRGLVREFGRQHHAACGLLQLEHRRGSGHPRRREQLHRAGPGIRGLVGSEPHHHGDIQCGR